jgi:rhodanese-related sulfurtransferase
VIAWLLVLLLAGGGLVLWRRERVLTREVLRLRYLERELLRLREHTDQALRTTRGHLAGVLGGTPPDAEAVVAGRPFISLAPSAVDELRERRKPFVLDVRTPEEFAEGHLPEAVNIPLRRLEHHLDQLPSAACPILVYDSSGPRARAACEVLSERGFGELYWLEDGFEGLRLTTKAEG